MPHKMEYKYLVSYDKLNLLRTKIMPFLDKDKNLGENQDDYTVRSIYFDSPNFRYYYEKVEGIKARKKFRIRTYGKNTDAPFFVEIKQKNINSVKKHRLELDKKKIQDIFFNENGYEFRNSPYLEKYLHHFYRSMLKPTLLVTYEREAYFSRFNPSLRITLDKNLRSILFPEYSDFIEENRYEYALKGLFIVEIKFFNGMPAWLRNIIRDFNLKRQAVSKYVICLESHYHFKRVFKNRSVLFAR